MCGMNKMNIEQDDVLKEIAARIVSAFAPRMIVLYGSRATGRSHPESDHDLLIVWRDENPPPSRAATVRRALLGLDNAFDIAVVTPGEYERFRTRRTHIVAVASREGSLLYAA
jgi:predicted nucleotidyltransferase